MNVKNQMMGSISENVASEFKGGNSTVRSVVFVTLGLWFGAISYLAFHGAFVGSAESPPLPLLFGFSAPLAVFFASYAWWPAFREFILGADLRLVTAMQAWRWGGLGFLGLYANGVLPGLFAIPAGLGDMAVGITAPWILLALIRHPSFAASRRYWMWNIMGILDFVVAMSMGVLCSGSFHGVNGLIGNVLTSPMARLPLVLIPAYMVPIFIMLHFTALFQVRQKARFRMFATTSNG